jgi:acetyl esterase/lipase
MTRNSFHHVLGIVCLVAVPVAATAAAPMANGSYAVEAVKGLAYNEAADADPAKHKLDLYVPKGKKDFPVLFFVHGGTWRHGDRRTYVKLGDLFASHGIGTVIISYRLSPQVQHPAHIEDVARAFAWTCTHISRYGGRPGEIFACGHSAGAHLVSLLATDESFLKAQKRALKDIRGVISISGVYVIPPFFLSKVFGPDESVCKKASPLHNVKGNHPPFLLLYGDKDFPAFDLMAENMCKELKKCDCEASTRKIASRNHITIMTRLLEDEDPTRKAILDFIGKHKEK